MISFNAKKLLIPVLAAVIAKNVYTPVLVKVDSTTELTAEYSAAAPNQNC